MSIITGLLTGGSSSLLPYLLAAFGLLVALTIFFLWRWRSAKRQRDESRADTKFVVEAAKAKEESDVKLDEAKKAVDADPLAHVRRRAGGQ